jgi:membrane protease YdiL (CAAX protease family)
MLKMDYSPGYVSVAGSLQTPAASCEARVEAQFFSGSQKRFDVSLLVETAVVMAAVVLAIKVLANSVISTAGWFIAPAMLIVVALVPMAIRGNRFPVIGFSGKQIRLTFFVLWRVCMVVFPAMLMGLWLLRFYGFELPLRPVLPRNHNWACWIFYQFMYVAVAEEVFFRGYLQSNILMLTGTIECQRRWLWRWISIVLSAACFAVAHIIIGGQVVSVLTFLPGLVLGWLFVRTGSLLAPILFHGLANTCYFILSGLI